MSHRRLWVAAAIIALVIIVGFVLSVPHTRDVFRAPAPPVVTTVPPVTLHDVYKKGVHTITGSLMAPNACTVVTASARLQGDASSTERIEVTLSTSNDTGVCLELPTLIRFSTTITAPAHLPLTATVNDSVASTTSS